MGMPLYGQSFTLENANNNGLNAKAPGPGQAGEFTKAAGFLAYYEVSSNYKGKLQIIILKAFITLRSVNELNIKVGKWCRMSVVAWVHTPVKAPNGFPTMILK